MSDDLAFSPGKSKNQLMVVGGGIAGMEAALTAAGGKRVRHRRGHGATGQDLSHQ